MPEIIILDENCTGRRGADACKNAHKAGKSVHAITKYDASQPALIMPSWHFSTVEEARETLTAAYETAPIISSDDELYAARAAGIAHKLPVGWIDPTMR